MAAIQSYPPKTKKELRKILDLVDNKNPIIAGMLEMSALTGLRYCDCSIIKKSDVLINGIVRNQIVVIQQKSYNKRLANGASKNAAKNGAKIIIPLGPQTKKLIEDTISIVRPETTYLFESERNKGHPYTAQYVNKILKGVAKELKLNYALSSHSFRKSFAMMLIKSGAKIHVVKARLGHASLASTDHYLSTFMEETDFYMEKLSF